MTPIHNVSAWVKRDPIGAYLVMLGVSYMLIGLTWALLPSHSRQMGVAWVPFVTQSVVAILWCLGGSMSVFTGIIAKTHRKWGFVGLQGVALFLTLVFLVSTVLGLLPWGPPGRVESVITAISYAALWASSWTVAQIPAPKE